MERKAEKDGGGGRGIWVGREVFAGGAEGSMG